MHASLSSLGRVPGGAETVVRGLLQALGPEGTLLLPALSYNHVDMDSPVFDLTRTASNVGAIPEYFRTRPGTVRSVHPTHSVCGLGNDVSRFLGDHHKDTTPCGGHSPFRRLRDLGGQVLFLGCGPRPNTSMHGVEEVAQAPYLFGETVDYRAVLPDGSAIEARCRRHGFKGWAQRYDRIEPLMSAEHLQTGRVLEATVHVLDCRAMWAAALEAMTRDPYHFVEERADS